MGVGMGMHTSTAMCPTIPATTAVPALQNVATEKRRERSTIGSRRAAASEMSHDSKEVYRME